MDVTDGFKNRSALVAYGSETGNAFDYAEELGRLLERIHFWTHVSKLDAIETSSLNNYSIIIIISSTTGQGDLPNNSRLFWKRLLRKKLSSTYLEELQFTTFGLGDSSYPKFNYAARKLHKRFLQLGANEIYPRGEADEQHEEGLDASFVPWSVDLRQHLLTQFPLPEGVEPISERKLLEPKWTLSLQARAEDLTNAVPDGNHEALPQANGDSEPVRKAVNMQPFRSDTYADLSSEPFFVTLDENRRMTPDTHWQDVRHLALTSQVPANYGPGDVLTIYPKNFTGDVDQLLERMGWVDIADKPICLTPTKPTHGSSFYPSPPIAVSDTTATLRTLLMEHLDVTAIPRRSFFSLIAHFTDDQFHKDRLLEFTKPEYVDELYDYTTRPRRSILEVLQEFDSVKIPWQWAATVLPELRGRQFSIASGGWLKTTSQGSTRFELLVAIVKYKTVIKKIREGVCTRYLANLPAGSQLRVTLQRGGLAITRSEALRPVIMIGPGTGVAPMRSMIWERVLWAQEMKAHFEASSAGQSKSLPLNQETLLFFGCRNQSADFFFHEEWDTIREILPFGIHAAFSRDQESKVYVQDIVRSEAHTVFRLLHESDGIVYVCGSSGKMPQAVRAALVDVLVTHGKMKAEVAEKYMQGMEKEGRYKQETW